jgi:hypothetical protein
MSHVGGEARLVIDVAASRDEVRTFGAAIGQSDATARVPTTFPIRWLTDPRIIAVIAGLAADRPGALPVHELQTITTVQPLPLDCPLTIEVEARRTDDIHIAVDATVREPTGGAVAIMHALLRLMA